METNEGSGQADAGPEKEKRAPLSFDEFCKLQNNFWALFSEGEGLLDILKKSAAFKSFSSDHPEMVEKLSRSMKQVRRYMKKKEEPPQNSPYKDIPGLEWDDIVKRNMNLPIYEEMYEAYLIMREYVSDDTELGILSRSELEKKEQTFTPIRKF